MSSTRRLAAVAWLLCAAILIPVTGNASTPTTIALTTTVVDSAGKDVTLLAANLLALMEVSASGRHSMQVVERSQLNLSLHELVLGGFQEKPGRLRLGTLVNAKLIVTAKLTPQENSKNLSLSVRVTESLTGVIRGGVLVPCNPLELEEAAREAVAYVAAVIKTPNRPATTIAVSPIDSLGQFDRLRPLERGLRDMIVSHLRERGDLRVLQRSNLQDLITEIDLARGGFVDPDTLPATLPSRSASLLLSGTINEHENGNKRGVTVDLKLINAATRKRVAEAVVTASPAMLAGELTRGVDRLLNANELAAPVNARDDALDLSGSEIETLYGSAIQDLLRTSRKMPRDFSERYFVPPDKQWSRGKLVPFKPRERNGRLVRVHHQQANPNLGLVRADTPLGQALIRKSIDRLESVVYLAPEHRLAQYALAWCYSFHIDGIWHPERARNLLLNVHQANPDSELGAAALDLLAERHFHHQRGYLLNAQGFDPTNDNVNKVQQLVAFDDILFALTKMAPRYRDYYWSRLSGKFSATVRLRDLDKPRRLKLLRAHVQLVEGGELILLSRAMRLLHDFSVADDSPTVKAEAQAALSRWRNDASPEVQSADLIRRAQAAYGKRDFRLAAELYQQQAAVLANDNPGSAGKKHGYFTAIRNAASSLRRDGHPREALALIKSCEPPDHPVYDLTRGYYGFEIGQCLEDLGKRGEALRTYLEYAEAYEDLVNNSRVDEKIVQLGGAPLNPDRKIDVEYIRGESGKEVHYQVLATDGDRLFLGNGYFDGQTTGVVTFDPVTRIWRTLPGMNHRVSSLAYANGMLWAGSEENGLWRCRLDSGTWESWDTTRGLPDNRVVDVLAIDSGAYVSVGERTAGGVAWITQDGEVLIDTKPTSPKVCLYHLTSDGESIWGVNRNLYRLNIAESKWSMTPHPTRKGRKLYTLFAHSDRSGLWLSRPKQEVFRLNASEQENQLYKEAWFQRKSNSKSGYSLRFASERNGYLWFCGEPWQRLLSSGLYRINLKTGEYDRFGPRDGFRIGGRGNIYNCRDAVWIGEHLWVASASGLVRVTPR